jgi:peptide/nickel transport system substrate-binding protein
MRVAGAALLTLLLVGCSEAPKPGNSASGLADCPSAPATCNSGDRKPGGEITWVVEQGWGNQWNNMRPEGAEELSRPVDWIPPPHHAAAS